MPFEEGEWWSCPRTNKPADQDHKAPGRSSNFGSWNSPVNAFFVRKKKRATIDQSSYFNHPIFGEYQWSQPRKSHGCLVIKWIAIYEVMWDPTLFNQKSLFETKSMSASLATGKKNLHLLSLWGSVRVQDGPGESSPVDFHAGWWFQIPTICFTEVKLSG